MAKFFIDRPVFAIVLAILIVLIGTIAGFNLPIAQYPQIQPPTVSVATTYVGANSGVVNQSVAQVIEEQVNGVQGMDYMKSNSDDTGKYSLEVVFDLGIDGDIASVKVQNNVSQANATLPNEVKNYGVVTKKSSSDMAIIFSFYSPENTHTNTFLNNYIKVYVLDAIKRVNGVGDVNIFGADFARRVWLNPDKMSELGLTTAEVIAAINDQNVQAPAGTVGAMPVDKNQEFQYTGQVKGRLESIEDFGNIIIKAKPNGEFIYLKDIGQIENSARSLAVESKRNGQNSVGMAILLTNDANAMDTVTEVRNVVETAAKDFPPDMKYGIIVDNTNYISASIKEVVHTFLEALALVCIIVFIFLQSWRATLIPMLAVPVSLIGTFGSFVILGFSINTLTLFAMVLAIGLVVDDAIVVIEAVEYHIKTDKLAPREATRMAMAEVSGPVVAIAFVLASVFIPVAFLGGMMGVLYRQFALTIAVSMGLSAFVALSLTPALCAMLLKPHKENEHTGRIDKFFNKFNDWFERVTASYTELVKKSISHAKYFLILLVVILAGIGFLMKIVPSTFIPDEDQAFVIASVSLPEGASRNRTDEVLKNIGKDILEIKGVEQIMTVAGHDILTSGAKPSAGTVFIGLDDWSLRKSPDTQINYIISEIYKKTAKYDEATVIAMNPPSLPGLGMVGGFTMVLQDIIGHSDEQLDKIAKDFLIAANTQAPEVSRVYTTYKNNSPSIEFDIDREKVKTLGVNLSDVFTALQVNFGGYEVNDFNMFGRTYKVIIQADNRYRNEADATRFIYVRSGTGKMVPLDSLVNPKTQTMPPIITRFNAARSLQINGSVAEGYSSGQAIAAMENLAKDHLPPGFKVEWSGQSREEVKTGSSTTHVMMLALLFVFLCLAALYESWSIPYAVLLSVPTGIFGAFFSQHIMGLENSIYMQIGVITLIGLAAKNAILIVEYAKVRVDSGMEPVQAAIEAAQLRLRPILMTSFAFIIGCLPLAMASGAGGGARNAMGTTVVGGMTIATGLGIFLIPVLFVVVEWVSEKLGFTKKPVEDEENDNPPEHPTTA